MIGRDWIGTRVGRRVAETGVAILAVVLAGCGGSEAVPRIPDGPASLEALGQEVWAALAEGDTAALRRLRLTERQHNELVWPELPASDPAAGFPVDFAWQNIRTRNAAALADLLPAFQGSTARLVDTVCEGPPETRETFRILRDCRLILEEANGSRRRVQGFRHVLEMDGRYRIFRYYSDE